MNEIEIDPRLAELQENEERLLKEIRLLKRLGRKEHRPGFRTHCPAKDKYVAEKLPHLPNIATPETV